MSQDGDTEHGEVELMEGYHLRDAGLAIEIADPAVNPGLPPHRPRLTDKDPKAEKRAERTIYGIFYLSLAASLWAVAAYMLFPIEDQQLVSIRYNNMFIGIGIGLALLAIGVGGMHWSKTVMSDKEYSEERHTVRGTVETRAAAREAFRIADEESGFGRRKMIRNSLLVAVGASILPGITLFRGLAPHSSPANPDAGNPVKLLKETIWDKGVHLTHDPSGTPIKASEVTLGSAFHVIPENLLDISHEDGMLNEKAKAMVLMVRLLPEQLHERESRKDWSYDGIVAYSKVCTHVGCPVALYEQQTHHLLCPCHQSQFDVTHEAKVIFGPASRPLPQLPITVDDEGYLVARSGFQEPVGPTFWERH